MDRLGAATLLLLFSPLFLVVTFLVWQHDRGPVFYRVGFAIFGQLSPLPVLIGAMVIGILGFVVANLLARPLPQAQSVANA